MYLFSLALEEEKRILICEMTTFKEKAWNMTNSSNATNMLQLAVHLVLYFPRVAI